MNKNKITATKTGARARRALAFVVALLALVCAFSIPVGAATSASCFADLEEISIHHGTWSGNVSDTASSELTDSPNYSAVRLPEFSSDTGEKHDGITIWALLQDFGEYEPYVVFGRYDGNSVLPPYPGFVLQKVCTFTASDALELYAISFTFDEWSTIINNANAPNAYNLYAVATKIETSWPMTIRFGVSFTSDFIDVCGSSILAAIQDEAHFNGYNEGYLEGEDYGYANGYQEGNSDGFAEGEDFGYAEGYENGKEIGYDEGYKQCVNDNPAIQGGLMAGMLDGIWNSMSSAWETLSTMDLGIGITIGGIVGTLILAFVVMLILKLVK